MIDLPQSVRVAVCQLAPILFDKASTVQKTIEVIDEAARHGAELVVFPESFIPAYPRGLSFGYVVGSRSMEGRYDWKRYYDNSMIVPSPDTDLIGSAAAKAHVYVSIGVTERDATSATLYCTNLFFGPDGTLLGKHRKLKPTGTERCIWGEGDGSTLPIIRTPFGVMGSLICWENYMPLARAAMYQKGVSLYLAPTADSRDEWQATMRHIALEGRCFVIGCNQYVTKSMYPPDLYCGGELKDLPENMCPGGSCIYDPFGRCVAGPVFGREEILYADLALDDIVLSRMDFDPSGHYSRPDVFVLKVCEPDR